MAVYLPDVEVVEHQGHLVHTRRRADEALHGYERVVIEDRAPDAASQGPLLRHHRHPSVRDRNRCHALQREHEDDHNRRE
eukprot:3406349-Heterocapsa_arctica.AAC.1